MGTCGARVHKRIHARKVVIHSPNKAVKSVTSWCVVNSAGLPLTRNIIASKSNCLGCGVSVNDIGTPASIGVRTYGTLVPGNVGQVARFDLETPERGLLSGKQIFALVFPNLIFSFFPSTSWRAAIGGSILTNICTGTFTVNPFCHVINPLCQPLVRQSALAN